MIGGFTSKSIVLRSSLFYVFLVTFVALFSSALLVYFHRYHSIGIRVYWTLFLGILALMFGSLLFETSFMGTVLNQRGLTLTEGDIKCFWHSVVSTIGPLLVFPIFFRQFFFARPFWALTFMSFHLALLGSLLNELKCPDRELWHLILGHQTPVMGVMMILCFIFLIQRGFSLKLSVLGKR